MHLKSFVIMALGLTPAIVALPSAPEPVAAVARSGISKPISERSATQAGTENFGSTLHRRAAPINLFYDSFNVRVFAGLQLSQQLWEAYRGSYGQGQIGQACAQTELNFLYSIIRASASEVVRRFGEQTTGTTVFSAALNTGLLGQAGATLAGQQAWQNDQGNFQAFVDGIIAAYNAAGYTVNFLRVDDVFTVGPQPPTKHKRDTSLLSKRQAVCPNDDLMAYTVATDQRPDTSGFASC